MSIGCTAAWPETERSFASSSITIFAASGIGSREYRPTKRQNGSRKTVGKIVIPMINSESTKKSIQAFLGYEPLKARRKKKGATITITQVSLAQYLRKL